MQRVYVAGPYSADNVLSVLNNIRYGMRVATQVLLDGYAPFCPWLDFHFQLMLRPGEELTVPHYYDYSMAWLEAADIVLVLPGWETSKGTKEEVRVAKEKGIPVIFIDKDERWSAIARESPFYMGVGRA